MKKEIWSNILGCAIGAFIGTLIAFEIHSRLIWGEYLWILGAFAGGIVGWCAGEFRELQTSYGAIAGWKPDWIYWKASIALIAGLTMCLISSILPLFVVLITCPEEPAVSIMSLFFLVVIFISIASTALFLTGLLSIPFIKKKEGDDKEVGWLLFKFGNPIVLPFVVIWFIVSYLRENGSHIIPFMVFAAEEAFHLVKRVLVYAHSEKRRIRFIGAFIGTVAGFFLGSAIIGAIAGAMAGGISREFIAIRWLKIIPAKAG